MPSLTLAQFIALQIGGIVLFVSLAVTGFASIGGMGDIPDHRSSHARVTPTSGGLGMVAGVGAGIAVAAIFHADTVFTQPGSAGKLATLLALAFAHSMLGLLDDKYTLPTTGKFVISLLLCFFAANAIGSITMLPFGRDHIYLLWWSGLGGTVLWLFTVTNGINFIDGINGLFGLTMGIASGALCLLALSVGAPVTALISGCLCAALVGFLPYNYRRRARVFAGDVGSLFVAFLYAGAVVFLIHEQPELKLLYAGPILILPLLTDVLITLVRKPFKGMRLTEPHNIHIFQRWARARGGHLRVSLVYGLATSTMALLVVFALDRGTLGSFWGMMMLAGLLACIYAVATSWLPD